MCQNIPPEVGRRAFDSKRVFATLHQSRAQLSFRSCCEQSLVNLHCVRTHITVSSINFVAQ